MAHESHEFPRAVFGKSPQIATTILLGNPIFKSCVDSALESVPEEYRVSCLCLAAECYQVGMVARAFERIVDLAPDAKPRVRRRAQLQQLKTERKKIVEYGQSVGILPTGLLWFVARWFVLPFVMEMLKKWFLGDDESDPKDDGR